MLWSSMKSHWIWVFAYLHYILWHYVQKSVYISQKMLCRLNHVIITSKKVNTSECNVMYKTLYVQHVSIYYGSSSGRTYIIWRTILFLNFSNITIIILENIVSHHVLYILNDVCVPWWWFIMDRNMLQYNLNKTLHTVTLCIWLVIVRHFAGRSG